MVQDVPNYRAHVEARAQRPLWVLLVLLVLAIWAVAAWGPRSNFSEPIRRAAMIEAAGLFGEGLVVAARHWLDGAELRGAPEGAFLSAVIGLYQGDMDLSEIHRLLEIAAEAGIPGADTLFGWVLLAEKDCADCRPRAQRWFERALMARADRDARLGLAAALTLPGAELSIPRAHYSALLAEDAEDVVHLRALTLRGSIEPSKVAATAHTEEAAREGFAEAQFRLWKRYLSGVDPHARLWLAMAALQGHVPAIEQIEASVLPAMSLAAESRLLAMADDPDTALGRAAEWCGGQGGRDADWLKRCRLTALEAHIACILPGSVTDTLGLKTFERSEIYARCRIVEMTDLRQLRPQ